MHPKQIFREHHASYKAKRLPRPRSLWWYFKLRIAMFLLGLSLPRIIRNRHFHFALRMEQKVHRWGHRLFASLK